jgi:hypothetical protein
MPCTYPRRSPARPWFILALTPAVVAKIDRVIDESMLGHYSTHSNALPGPGMTVFVSWLDSAISGASSP